MMSLDQAVVLYGSVARGDADNSSDVDVLVISPNAESYDEQAVVGYAQGRPINVSHYTWPEFEAMSVSGSLFIRHLAAEAKPIVYEGNGEEHYRRTLNMVTEYCHAERDLASFRLGIDDCRRGFHAGSSGEYEMAVLGGIARHSSVLACYLAGVITFGRMSITKACQVLGMEDIAATLVLAHRFRLFEQRQCLQPKTIDGADVTLTIDACDKFIDAVSGLLNDK
ncbi:hypothetical protein CWI75_00710 [Kineobactrum sediminis]|uniref:Polymerase nucleotidyl transferase domain-containing protein n=1 Tax=Kineobactrum sediminis TaxID=1905677 RepID=A0A2N5Y697_9GAMM|nr:nucleotidyltransferase domain-containing protein [Kineobactrum sediminis]PLW83915.1 hypothetical protein CWI75_00710 [Kineobactrum sediminis]